MAEFWSYIFTVAASFGLGYWVAGHPEDTRKILQRVRDSLGRLVNRIKGDKP